MKKSIVLFCMFILLSAYSIAVAASVSVGDRYAFAGFSSGDIVPDFAKEISDFNDSDANRVTKAVTFFGFGGDREPFSDKVFTDYGKKVFAKMKTLSTDGKVYKTDTISWKIGAEVADVGDMKKWGKGSGTFCYAYPYNNTWVMVKIAYRKSFSGKTEGMYGLDVTCQTFHKQ